MNGSSAYIVFADEEGLKNALSLKEISLIQADEGKQIEKSTLKSKSISINLEPIFPFFCTNFSIW